MVVGSNCTLRSHAAGELSQSEAVTKRRTVHPGARPSPKLRPVPSSGIGQWLQWGGIDFLLLTGRLTNVFLMSLPGGIVFLCLWLALLGLVVIPDDRGQLMLGTTLLFWGAFLIIGEPHNLYWGLLYAPMIPFGWVRGGETLVWLFRGALR